MPSLHHISLESAIHTIGREIFHRAESSSPPAWSMEYLQQSALNWLTQKEALKLNLFRFVDVLPELNSPMAVVKHLKDYVQGTPDDTRQRGEVHLPAAIQLVLGYRRFDSVHAHCVAKAVRLACVQGARRFIAGSTAQEAIVTVRKLRRSGMGFTLDVLGETVISDRVARRHQDLYIHLIRRLCHEARQWRSVPLLDLAPWGRLPRVNISIKLSAIVTRMDPIDPVATTRAVLDRLRPILRTAQDCGAFINIDMEHHAVKDLTLEIYRRILSEPAFRDWPDCGIVIQCYMPDGETDLAELIHCARRRGTPITVRLVKGAYWDSETAEAVRNGWPIPLYTEKWQSDAAFERMARLMLENADIIRPAFASHNVRSIAAALAIQEALGLPERTLEVQMLTGMADPLKRALTSMKQRLRVYSPFGDLVTGMAYLIRRLLENTANESFLRQSFGQHLPIDALLQRPSGSGNDTSAALPRPFIQDPDETHDMKPFENEPNIDFSQSAHRHAMQEALSSVRRQFGRTYPAIIDNTPIETGDWIDSLNPSDPRQVVGRVARCDSAIADRAVAAARSAFQNWAETPTEQRADVLERAADILRSRRFEFAAWMIHEAGKTWREACGDFMETADYLRFYSYEMRRLVSRPRRRDYPGESNTYLYSPRGVVLVLSPFCFPTALLTGMTAAALVMGNTVIVKPASDVPVCAAIMIDVLNEAGLPPGVLNIVYGPGEQIGSELVRHPGVDCIAFTGSSEVGRRIVEAARPLHPKRDSFKHVIAEMGGKNAIIIDEDADLNEAVLAVIASSFGYAGQKCTASSRVIVLESVHQSFLGKLVEAAEAIEPAPADLPGTTVGPLINADAAAHAERFMEMGKLEARCLLGGKPIRNSGKGCFLAPTIFADVAPEARIAREECLAPILAVLQAGTFEQAVDIANDVPYGLVGGVYSRSPRNIEVAKRRLQVGMLYINRKITLSRVDRQPFGGLKMSGLGTKTGGPDYLQQFATARTISENTARHGCSPKNDKIKA